MISVLLDDTTMTLRFNDILFEAFKTNIGVPQGDSLSPLLFIIYLEAALRDLSVHLHLDLSLLKRLVAYADDCDFICDNLHLVDLIESHAPAVLSEWNLNMNLSKSEFTHIDRRKSRTDENWRNTKKLGSLLGDTEDVSRRKHLAQVAYRIRLYNADVKSVLLYNCGTWGLTDTVIKSLESFHRAQLRRVLGIHYPEHVSNASVYSRCECKPLRYNLLKARWKCFGHILRRDKDIPAYTQMETYYEMSGTKWPGKRMMCLPLRLHTDLQMVNKKLLSNADLVKLRELAQDRVQWNRLTETLLEKLMKKYNLEEKTRLQKKKEAKRQHDN